MQVMLSQLNMYLSGVWRFRWTMLISAWLFSIAGWLLVYQLPEKYMATARVHIDSNNVLRPLLRGLAIQPNVAQRVQLMSQTLLSRPNLEKLMRMTDLDLQVKNDLAKEQMLSRLGETISLGGDRRNSSLYSIEFKHPDRDTARRIVQSLISVFIESVLGGKRVDSADAQEFLDKQIAEYEERLAEAESRLADFKRRYVGTMPGSEGGYYQRMEEAKAKLNAAQLQLKEMENRRADLEGQISGEEPVFLSSDSEEIKVVSSVDVRIDEMNRQLDNLLIKYTERHPAVVQIKGLIDSLKLKRESEIEADLAQRAPSYGDINNNLVYQQMRSMLAETEAGIAELKVRVNVFETRAKELEKKVDNVPLIEAELQQLNRDYQVVSQQHDNLLKRRESARMSQQVEQGADDVKFRVIDPPFVPIKATEPNKLLLNVAVLFIAIGISLGIALLLSLLRPVITDRHILGQVTGLPVFGSVGLVMTAGQKRKAFFGKLVFASLMFCLVLVFAGVNLKYGFDIDLMAKIKQLQAGLL